MALTLKLRYLYNLYVLNFEDQRVFSLVTLASNNTGFNLNGWRQIAGLSESESNELKNSLVITAYADNLNNGKKYTRFKSTAAGEVYGWGNKLVSAADYNSKLAISVSKDGSYLDYNFQIASPSIPSIGDIYSMFLPTILLPDLDSAQQINLLSEYVSLSQLNYVPMSQPVYMKKRRIVTYIGRDTAGSIKTAWAEVGEDETSGYNSVDTGYVSAGIVSNVQTFFSDYYTPTIVYDRQVFDVSNSTAISKSDSSVQEAHKALVLKLNNFGEIRGERKINNKSDFELFVKLTRGSFHHNDIIGYANYALPFSMYLNQVGWISAAITDSDSARNDALANIMMGTGEALYLRNMDARGDAIKINLITDNRKNRILGAKLGLDLSKIVDSKSIFVNNTEQQNGQKLWGNANGGRLYVSEDWTKSKAKDIIYNKLSEAVSAIGLKLGSSGDKWKLSGKVKQNNVELPKSDKSQEIILGTSTWNDHVAKFESHIAKDTLYFNGANLACGYLDSKGNRKAHMISLVCDDTNVLMGDEFLLTLKTRTYSTIPRFGDLSQSFSFGNPNSGRTNSSSIRLGTQYFTDLVQENEFLIIIKADRCRKALKPEFNSDDSFKSTKELPYLMPYSDGKFLGHVLYMPYTTQTLMTSDSDRAITISTDNSTKTTKENSQVTLNYTLPKSFAFSQKHLNYESLTPVDKDKDPLKWKYSIFNSNTEEEQVNLFRVTDLVIEPIYYKWGDINARLINAHAVSGGNPNLDNECALAIQCGLILNDTFSTKNKLQIIIYRKPFDLPKDSDPSIEKGDALNLNYDSTKNKKSFTFTNDAPNEYCLYSIEGEAKIVKLNSYATAPQKNLITYSELLKHEGNYTSFDPKKFYSQGFAGSLPFKPQNANLTISALRDVLLNYGFDKSKTYTWLHRNSKWDGLGLIGDSLTYSSNSTGVIKDYRGQEPYQNIPGNQEKDLWKCAKNIEEYCQKLIDTAINIDDKTYIYIGSKYERYETTADSSLLYFNKKMTGCHGDVKNILSFAEPQVLRPKKLGKQIILNAYTLEPLSATKILAGDLILKNIFIYAGCIKKEKDKTYSASDKYPNLTLLLPAWQEVLDQKSLSSSLQVTLVDIYPSNNFNASFGTIGNPRPNITNPALPGAITKPSFQVPTVPIISAEAQVYEIPLVENLNNLKVVWPTQEIDENTSYKIDDFENPWNSYYRWNSEYFSICLQPKTMDDDDEQADLIITIKPKLKILNTNSASNALTNVTQIFFTFFTSETKDRAFKLYYPVLGHRNIELRQLEFTDNFAFSTNNLDQKEYRFLTLGLDDVLYSKYQINAWYWDNWNIDPEGFLKDHSNPNDYLGFGIKNLYSSLETTRENIGLKPGKTPTGENIVSIIKDKGTNFITINSAGYIEINNSKTNKPIVTNEDIKKWMFPLPIQDEWKTT